MKNPLLDKVFLEKLDEQRQREVFAKVIALTFDEYPVEEITGRVTQGSISVDGTSAVRRSFSLTLSAGEIPEIGNFKISDFYWGLNSKVKLFVGLKNDIDDSYPEIIWFPQGIFLLTSFNTSTNATSYNVTLQGKDKMALLNGDIGGVITAKTVDFGTLFEIDEDNNVVKQKVLLKDIIVDAVHEYAKEPYQNIIVNDLDTTGLELIEYRGSDPLYLFMGLNTTQVLDWTNRPYGDYYYFQEDGTRIDIDTLENIPVYDSRVRLDLEDVTTEPTIVYNDAYDYNFTVIKCMYGESIGYRITDMVYAGDLIAQVGNSITQAVLDKIKQMLGDFQYYYNVDGQFVFERAKNYVNQSWNNLSQEGDEFYGEAAAAVSSHTYSFTDANLITAYQDNPSLGDIKNDFSIWGTRTSSFSGASIPVHLRYAINKKPYYYKTFYGDKIYYTDKCPADLISTGIEEFVETEDIRLARVENRYKEKLEDIELRYNERKELCQKEYYDKLKNLEDKYTRLQQNIEDKYAIGDYEDKKAEELKKLDERFLEEKEQLEENIKNTMQEIEQYKIDKLEALEAWKQDLLPSECKLYGDYDWREIIYQMSLDYMQHSHRNADFQSILSKNNQDLYPSGLTNYEQYYTDIYSFWRDLYNPDIKAVDKESLPNPRKDYYFKLNIENKTFEQKPFLDCVDVAKPEYEDTQTFAFEDTPRLHKRYAKYSGGRYLAMFDEFDYEEFMKNQKDNDNDNGGGGGGGGTNPPGENPNPNPDNTSLEVYKITPFVDLSDLNSEDNYYIWNGKSPNYNGTEIPEGWTYTRVQKENFIPKEDGDIPAFEYFIDDVNKRINLDKKHAIMYATEDDIEYYPSVVPGQKYSVYNGFNPVDTFEVGRNDYFIKREKRVCKKIGKEVNEYLENKSNVSQTQYDLVDVYKETGREDLEWTGHHNGEAYDFDYAYIDDVANDIRDEEGGSMDDDGNMSFALESDLSMSLADINISEGLTPDEYKILQKYMINQRQPMANGKELITNKFSMELLLKKIEYFCVTDRLNKFDFTRIKPVDKNSKTVIPEGYDSKTMGTCFGKKIIVSGGSKTPKVWNYNLIDDVIAAANEDYKKKNKTYKDYLKKHKGKKRKKKGVKAKIKKYKADVSKAKTIVNNWKKVKTSLSLYINPVKYWKDKLSAKEKELSSIISKIDSINKDIKSINTYLEAIKNTKVKKGSKQAKALSSLKKAKEKQKKALENNKKGDKKGITYIKNSKGGWIKIDGKWRQWSKLSAANKKKYKKNQKYKKTYAYNVQKKKAEEKKADYEKNIKKSYKSDYFYLKSKQEDLLFQIQSLQDYYMDSFIYKVPLFENQSKMFLKNSKDEMAQYFLRKNYYDYKQVSGIGNLSDYTTRQYKIYTSYTAGKTYYYRPDASKPHEYEKISITSEVVKPKDPKKKKYTKYTLVYGKTKKTFKSKASLDKYFALNKIFYRQISTIIYCTKNAEGKYVPAFTIDSSKTYYKGVEKIKFTKKKKRKKGSKKKVTYYKTSKIMTYEKVSIDKMVAGVQYYEEKKGKYTPVFKADKNATYYAQKGEIYKYSFIPIIKGESLNRTTEYATLVGPFSSKSAAEASKGQAAPENLVVDYKETLNLYDEENSIFRNKDKTKYYYKYSEKSFGDSLLYELDPRGLYSLAIDLTDEKYSKDLDMSFTKNKWLDNEKTKYSKFYYFVNEYNQIRYLNFKSFPIGFSTYQLEHVDLKTDKIDPNAVYVALRFFEDGTLDESYLAKNVIDSSGHVSGSVSSELGIEDGIEESKIVRFPIFFEENHFYPNEVYYKMIPVKEEEKIEGETYYKLSKDYLRYEPIEDNPMLRAIPTAGENTIYKAEFVDLFSFKDKEDDNIQYYEKGDFNPISYWTTQLNSPETLNFWFDFLDTDGAISKYSSSAIGNRPKAVNDDKVKSIYFRDTPTLIFFDSNIGEEEFIRQRTLKQGYSFIQLTGDMNNLFSISGQGKSAMDALDTMLYQNTYGKESITLTTIPIYHLIPNTRIYVRNDDSGINGEYIIDKFTIPLAYNGTMTINASKAIERLY